MAGRGRLKAAVYVTDPGTHEDLILLPGDSPAPEIAVLVTNSDAWDVPPQDEAEPETIAVAKPDAGQGGAGTKKSPSRRTRPSSA